MQDTEFKIALPSQYGVVWVFVIMAGLILPVLLIPVVAISGYTEVVEEVAKALVVLFLILKLPSTKERLLAGVIFGFLFGLSESMFYLTTIFHIGDFGIFWQRFLFTVPMHITTVLILVSSGLTKKKFLFFGFAGALALHLLFNYSIINF